MLLMTVIMISFEICFPHVLAFIFLGQRTTDHWTTVSSWSCTFLSLVPVNVLVVHSFMTKSRRCDGRFLCSLEQLVPEGEAGCGLRAGLWRPGLVGFSLTDRVGPGQAGEAQCVASAQGCLALPFIYFSW